MRTPILASKALFFGQEQELSTESVTTDRVATGRWILSNRQKKLTMLSKSPLTSFQDELTLQSSAGITAYRCFEKTDLARAGVELDSNVIHKV